MLKGIVAFVVKLLAKNGCSTPDKYCLSGRYVELEGGYVLIFPVR